MMSCKCRIHKQDTELYHTEVPRYVARATCSEIRRRALVLYACLIKVRCVEKGKESMRAERQVHHRASSEGQLPCWWQNPIVEFTRQVVDAPQIGRFIEWAREILKERVHRAVSAHKYGLHVKRPGRHCLPTHVAAFVSWWSYSFSS